MYLTGLGLLLLAAHCSGLCPSSNAPVIENANYCVHDVQEGQNFTYTCAINYRVAPKTTPVPQTRITVTCLDSGEFSTPAGECVYAHPEGCIDYFHRDDMYEEFPDGACNTVTIDPLGPALLTDPTNPPAMTVKCCKESSTPSVTTQVIAVVSSSLTARPSYYHQSCHDTNTPILYGITDHDVDPSAVSSFCADTLTSVTYSNYEDEIYTVLSQSTGTCTQTITMECDAEFNGISPIFQFNHQFSGFMYGMGHIAHSIAPTTYLGGVCDCAISPYPYLHSCEGGCNCVRPHPGETFSRDTITRHLTAAYPSYVTHYQYSTHDNAEYSLLNNITMNIGDIVCTETYPYTVVQPIIPA